MSRILAPDSSPSRDAKSASKASSNSVEPSSGPNSSSAFDSTGFSRTKFNLQHNSDGASTKQGLVNQEANMSSSTSTSHHTENAFKSSLEGFRYNGPGSTNAQAITLDDDENFDLGDLSSLSSLSDFDASANDRNGKPPKKRRKFVLQRSPRLRSASLSSDIIMYEKGDEGTPGTSTSSRENGTLTNGEEKLSMVQRLLASRSGISADEARRALAISNGSIDSAIKWLDQRVMEQPGERPRQVITIPESPASSSSSPAKTAQRASTSPPVTESLIKPRSSLFTPSKPGVQVVRKIAKIAPFRRKSPEHADRPRPNPAKESKTLQRVREHDRSARSTPTTDGGNSSSDEDSEGDGNFDDEKNERKALQWFNHNDEKQLVDIIGLMPEQAKTIIGLRPFQSTDELTAKLNATKGVQPRMFYNCVDLMSGLQRIDSVLEKCEKMGQKMNSGLSKWSGDTKEDPGYLYRQPKGASEGVKLKDFQMYGVNWLNLLYRTHCSGILADDMGLGKTAQIITFLNHIVLGKSAGPHLIVVPSSVLTNWMREFSVFGPELRVFKYHGSQKERNEQQHELKAAREEYDIVLTTYDMASGGERDHNFLRKYDFETAIYDEGHILKNQKSVKYSKLMRIKAEWRLLLTGTPLQNNLSELISLLKFIMPAYFRGAEEALDQIFSVNQETQLSRERIKRAKQMMRPFVLRRKKVDVLDSLKRKTELVRFCDMTLEQRKVYRDAFAKSRAALLQQREQETTALETRSRTKIEKQQTVKSGHVLMELRKAANHPLLFRRLYDDRKIENLAKDYLKVAEHATEDLQEKKEDFSINSDAELCMSIAMQYPECVKHKLPDKEWLNSGKITALRDVIEEAQAKGERLIVFSQFVQTLEIICRALEVFGITYRGFTGSTDVNSRQEIVDEFTRDKSIACFLLSTRAGGVGINLTAANWVVLFDQDFNPQNDQQAADRCYRMGQEREVTVVRLISRGTIDEHIYKLGKSKLQLADRVQADHDDARDEDEVIAENQNAVEKKVEQSLLAGLLADDSDEMNVNSKDTDSHSNTA